MSQYFISADGQTQEGPLSIEQVRERLARTPNAAGMLAWREGLPAWAPVGQVPELAGLLPSPMLTPVAPPIPAPAVTSQPNPQAVTQAVPQPMRTFAPPQVAGPISTPARAGQADGLAIASLILGCVSILASCMHVLSLPISITGLVLGLISKTRVGVRTAGIITSICGMGIAVIWLIVVIIISMSN
ncbi:MAG: hypothetical protein HBSAPP03_16920 [Phycisphaerae bacterium]|nr:MAG: hypothetical protein HBSAPP03_16920 [Phycisphaerae bacterium]